MGREENENGSQDKETNRGAGKENPQVKNGDPVQLFGALWTPEFGEEKFGKTSWRPALFRRHQVQSKSRPA
jgi:hypothetical protein